MVGDALCRLTGCRTARQSWLSLFSPAERIGIKVNALGGRHICTRPELVYAVVDHLTACGVPPRNIIIWDRLTRELHHAGYPVQTSPDRLRCFGTDNEYEFEPEFSGSIGSCFSRILTRHCDAIISIPVLKDHDLAGVSLNLKNFYGVIHNPNKYHDNGCDPYIADLNAHPHIRQKLRLCIIDGLRSHYNGGPGFKPRWSHDFKTLLFSLDPVAADSIGAAEIEKQRIRKDLPLLKETGRDPVHIRTAARKGLGTADLGQIEKIIM